MRVVITGASGNVGTALLKRVMLADTDHQVVGITRRRPPSVDVYRFVQWYQLDIAERNSVTWLQRPFAKAHSAVHPALAFQPGRKTSYLDRVAISGSEAVLIAPHAAGVGQLVHMSWVGRRRTQISRLTHTF